MGYFIIEDSRLLNFITEQKGSKYLQSLEDAQTSQVAMKLHVVRSSGYDVTPDYNIVVSDLNTGSDGFIYKKFYNRGFGGIQFKITIILEKGEIWKSSWYQKYKGLDTYEHNILTVLKELMRTMTPVKVITDAINIPNGNYIITKNPSRKQSHDNTTTWELEFTTYRPIKTPVYKNDNTRVKKAIASAKARKAVTAKKTSSAKKAAKKSAFGKCKRTVLVYSKKQKKVDCVKTLQKILQKKGYYKGKIDGWFGSMTKTAVQKFQKAYNKKQKKKNKLPTNGKIDVKTFKALGG